MPPIYANVVSGLPDPHPVDSAERCGAGAAKVSIHLDTAVAVVTYWLVYITSRFSCLSTALWACKRTSFRFAIDIW